MAILVGIDGTGGGFSPTAARDRRYDADFVNSFVSRLCKGKANAQYNRGPVTLGGGLDVAISNGLNFITQKRRQGNNEPILLTGYSRGALGVLVIAQRLQRQNMNVAAALLFDCVDRHGDYEADTIPNNIAKVLHLRRGADSGSRESFGNAGTRYVAPTSYSERYFRCTHGGMGGTPWQPEAGQSPNDLISEDASEAVYSFVHGNGYNSGTNVTFAQDRQVSEQIWTFVQPFIQENGFNVR